MSRIKKLRQKLFSNPIRNDMTFDEITALADAYGCKLRQGGNHTCIVSVETGRVIPIPRHGKCVKEVYIKQLRDLFEEIEEMQEGDL